jgi:hypothetical protein
VFLRNTFYGTSSPAQYLDGGTETTSDNRDVIYIRLGGIDNSTIIGLSAGWSYRFTLPRRSNLTISILFELEVRQEFEAEEITDVLCSLDDQILLNGEVEYLARLSGNGQPGFITTGFQEVILTPKNVDPGNHTLVVGAHLTRKTFPDEVAVVRFDRVQVQASASRRRALIADETASTEPNLRRRARI